LVIYLSKIFEQRQLSILCLDDEIARRHNFFSQIKINPGSESDARKACWFPAIVQDAFESIERFVIPEQPWRDMLSIGRNAQLEIVPYLLPLKNNIFVRRGDLPATSRSTYILLFFPKPSIGLEFFKKSVEMFMSGWKAKHPLRIVTFRNDLHSRVVNGCDIRCYPYPVNERHYHEIMASCNGMVIVPRGGLSTIRDAVRYGLDMFSDPFDFSPNRTTLTAAIGLTLEDPRSPPDVVDGYVTSPETKRRNMMRLGAFENKCIQWFRNEFGAS
jgi:hypothetical protein